MKQNKKRMALTAGLFAVMTLAAGCGKAEIGYVDPSRVEKEAPAIVNIDAEMKSKMEEVQKQAQEELKEKQAQGAPPEEMQKAQQQAMGKMQQTSSIYDQQKTIKLQTAVGEIARTKKLDAVLFNVDEQKLVHLGGTDITDDVIKALQ